MKNHFLIFVFAMFCVVCVLPAMATDNPYKNAGMVLSNQQRVQRGYKTYIIFQRYNGKRRII